MDRRSASGRTRELDPITCAFCIGDADRIARSFLGHHKRAFRTGEVADRFVELGVHYADVVTHLADAAADVLGLPRPGAYVPTYVGGGDDEGMWVERLPSAWVQIVASVPPGRAPEVIERWTCLAREGYEADPGPWDDPALLGSVRELAAVAAESISGGKPLLGLAAI